MVGNNPRVGVLALQGDVREHLRVLGAVGADAVVVRRESELASVAGLVIPGGESTTISKLLDIFQLRQPLEQRIKAGMPVYGSCAGMIMLAERLIDSHPDQQPLGAIPMTVRRNAFGRQVDSFEGELTMAGIAGPPLHAVFIRAPWVEEVAPEVEVLATAPVAGADRIVAVRYGAALATAFHPELTSDSRVHEYFMAMVRDLG